MIYLIGGPPKCGKTYLAQKLSLAYNIPWISVDTLQCVAQAYVAKKDIPKKFPWGQIRKQTKRSNDLVYNKYTAKHIISAYQSQAKTSYPAIEMVAVSEITSGHSYIIEGYQVEPRLADRLVKKYGRKYIKPIFLIKTDPQKFIQNIKKSTTPHDWIIQRTKNKTTYPKIADMICKYGKYFEREARRYHFDVFGMDDEFNGKINDIIKYLKK